MSDKSKKTNRLANERSPYLQQHKHNPVDWYPWGNEAFSLAKKTDRPIFLSVGYSTCHWCHVMERESFEDNDVAQVLNNMFVPIKVDREERPDVDRIYMTYVQQTTGGGGWPMSVWLTPDLKPFFAGTYFPPSGKYGRPGFKDILNRINQLWSQQRSDIVDSANDVVDKLDSYYKSEQSIGGHQPKMFETGSHWPGEVLETYYNMISKSFDSTLGGFSRAPKFPRPVIFTALFHYYNHMKTEKVLQMCEFTLQMMAKGGMYDHLGGGFHRYSVDKYWHVPHFEKMLYDQAQLVHSYLTAYQITKKSVYANIAHNVLNYVAQQMQSKEGGFFSAEDADSKISHDSEEHAEGAFYVWSKSEIDQLLGKDSEMFCYHFGVKEEGNAPPESDPHKEFVKKNILYQKHELDETAQKFGHSPEEAAQNLKQSMQKLLEVRNQRPRPFLDDKIITAWNGLMISAFAQASVILSNVQYLDVATKAAQFIKNNLYQGEHLIRNYREKPSDIKGFADDYAFMINALIDLYEAGGDVEWLKWAINLQDTMDKLFFDPVGGYFATEKDAESIVLRLKEEYDGAEPSPNSFAVKNLVRLHNITQKQEYRDRAKTTLRFYRDSLSKTPIIFPQMVASMDMFFDSPTHITLASDGPNDEKASEFMKTIYSHYAPSTVLLHADGANGQEYLCSLGIDYVKKESMKANNDVTAYVCRNTTCNIAHNQNELERLLTVTQKP